MPEGAAETVKLLSKNYALGLVTSRISERLFGSPELENLETCFSALVSYQDTENHKPHPEPLLLAAAKLQVAPAECVYVGDAVTDVTAARAAGMKVVIYGGAVPGADAYAKDLRELPRLVAELDGQ